MKIKIAKLVLLNLLAMNSQFLFACGVNTESTPPTSEIEASSENQSKVSLTLSGEKVRDDRWEKVKKRLNNDLEKQGK
jgi:hypothetical protein